MKKIASQSGNVLFIGLMLLIVLTIIGISTMNRTLVEERMALNYQDKHQSFQAAESALSVMEAWLDRTSAVEIESQEFFFPTSSGGGYPDLSAQMWDSRAKVIPINSGGSNHLAIDPKAIVELAYVDRSLKKGQGEEKKNTQTRYYRVTARGTGLTDKAISMTQSTAALKYEDE